MTVLVQIKNLRSKITVNYKVYEFDFNDFVKFIESMLVLTDNIFMEKSDDRIVYNINYYEITISIVDSISKSEDNKIETTFFYHGKKICNMTSFNDSSMQFWHVVNDI